MRDDQHRFLMIHGRLPARLTTEQTAWVLNCRAHDVPILVSKRLIKPLGNPPPNGIKYFAADEIVEISKDRTWLSKETTAIYRHWHIQNLRRRKNSVNEATKGVQGERETAK